MHVIVLIITVFFADGSKPPTTLFSQAPSVEACRKKAPELQAVLKARDGVRGVSWACVDLARQDTA